MSQNIVSAGIVEPYAEALMSVAQSEDLTDRLGEDVNFLLETLHSSEDLQQFLANPLIQAEAKKAVLRQICQEQLHSYTLNFLMLLVDRRRIFLLAAICQHYQALLRKLNNTVLAEVVSTIELSEAQQQTVAEKVKAMAGAQQVELETNLDQDLIGGVIIKVGSQVLDASIRGQLRRLSNSLMSSAG